MFGLSIEKIIVLVVVALFVLGPERLPAAATWVGHNLRRGKAVLADAQQRIQDELGPDYDRIREPLQDLRAPLQELRNLRDPRRALLNHLLDEPAPTAPPPTATRPPAAQTTPAQPAAAQPAAAQPADSARTGSE